MRERMHRFNVFDLVGSEYFHYPDSKSEEYKKLSIKLTTKYSTLTTYVLFSFLVLIAIKNVLTYRGWSNVYRLRLFKRICSRLNKEISKERDTRESSLKLRLARRTKDLTLKIFYHGGAMFQIVFWTILFSFLSLSEINDGDLIILGKRLGRIATSCLPTVFFITLRPSLLPETLYLSLLPIHKWLSRFVILQSFIHTVIYCGLFQKKRTWFKALKKENVFGIAAMLGFLVIIFTSLPKFRNRYYRVFYFQHYFWSWVIVVCLQLHARPVKITSITIVNIMILITQIIYRLKLSEVTASEDDLKVTNVSPNISIVEFPRSAVNNIPRTIGSHIRLTRYYPSIFARAYKQLIPNYHPYTLVTLPSDEKQMLIVRTNTFKILNKKRYIIYGSFDPFLHFIKYPQESKNFSISKLKVEAKRVMIVIGGSAISFAIPIMRVLNYNGIPSKVIWVIRDYRDISALNWFRNVIDLSSFEIFVTGIPEEYSLKSMRSENSLGRYVRIFGSSRTNSTDIENPETDYLLDRDNFSLNEENQLEDVHISMGDALDEYQDEEDCPQNASSIRSGQMDTISNHFYSSNQGGTDSSQYSAEVRTSISRSPRTYSSITGNYVPSQSSVMTHEDDGYMDQFYSIVKPLHLENRVYSGRPTLDHKYYSWCISGGFTQCSGPVEDNSSNLICCRDALKTGMQERVDSKATWVVSAGPQGLVKNSKLWANENGLNFHEEAFYV